MALLYPVPVGIHGRLDVRKGILLHSRFEEVTEAPLKLEIVTGQEFLYHHHG